MELSQFIQMPARELASVSKVREETLSKYFNNHRNPNYTTLLKMAINLNMSVEQVTQGVRLRRELKTHLSKTARK